MPRTTLRPSAPRFSPGRIRAHIDHGLFYEEALNHVSIHNGCVNTVRFSADGRLLLSGSDDRTLALTNTHTWGIATQIHTEHEGNIFDAHICGGRIFSACAGGVVLETDIERSTSRTLQTHSTECHTLAPSPDGSVCLAGTADGAVWSSDAREGVSRLALAVRDRHRLGVGVYDMQRCPQDEYLLGIVGCSPLLRLYDLRKPKGGPVSTFAPDALREQTALSISGMHWSRAGTHILLNYLDDFIYEVSVHCQREVAPRAEARYRPALPAPPSGARARSRGGRSHTKAESAATGSILQRKVCSSALAVPGTAFSMRRGRVARRTLHAREVQYQPPRGRSLRSTAAASKKAALPSCFGWVRRDLPPPPEPAYAKAQRAQSRTECKCDMPGCHNTRRVTEAPEGLDGSYVRCFKNRVSSSTIKGVRYMGPRDRFVVSGSDDGMVAIAERSTGNPVHVMQACVEGPANALAPHPSGAMLLAVGGLDDTVAIFDAVAEPQFSRHQLQSNAEVALSYAGGAIRSCEDGIGRACICELMDGEEWPVHGAAQQQQQYGDSDEASDWTSFSDGAGGLDGDAVLARLQSIFGSLQGQGGAASAVDDTDSASDDSGVDVEAVAEAMHTARVHRAAEVPVPQAILDLLVAAGVQQVHDEDA